MVFLRTNKMPGAQSCAPGVLPWSSAEDGDVAADGIEGEAGAAVLVDAAALVSGRREVGGKVSADPVVIGGEAVVFGDRDVDAPADRGAFDPAQGQIAEPTRKEPEMVSY